MSYDFNRLNDSPAAYYGRFGLPAPWGAGLQVITNNYVINDGKLPGSGIPNNGKGKTLIKAVRTETQTERNPYAAQSFIDRGIGSRVMTVPLMRPVYGTRQEPTTMQEPGRWGRTKSRQVLQDVRVQLGDEPDEIGHFTGTTDSRKAVVVGYHVLARGFKHPILDTAYPANQNRGYGAEHVAAVVISPEEAKELTDHLMDDPLRVRDFAEHVLDMCGGAEWGLLLPNYEIADPIVPNIQFATSLDEPASGGIVLPIR